MKKLSCFLAAFILIATVGSAQSIRKAQKKMNLYNYSKAVQILNKAINKEKHRNQAIPLLAECYRMQNDVFNAKAWYGQAIALPGANPEWFYHYGQALRSAGEYEKAKENFLKYASLKPEDPKGKWFASVCDTILLAWKNKMPAFDVRSVGQINSPYSDFGPSFFSGNMVFSSDRSLTIDESSYGWTGRGYLDVFFSRPNAPNEFQGDMTAPESFKGKFNQTYHDGPVAFSGGNRVYFTRTYKDKAKKENKIKTNLLKVFHTSLEDGKWKTPEPFFLNSPDYSVGHPALSGDGNIICFASDMPGGYGGTDLWICRKEGDIWGKPENLGKEINTQGDELFPSIQEDGSLLFSSDWLPGYGSLDIFCSKPLEGAWGVPGNLGIPLNSSFDDFAINYAPASKNGFFSSNRPSGAGNDDIYAFTRVDIKVPEPQKPVEPPKPAYISGIVKDKTTNLPVEGATVFIFNPNTGKVSVLKTGPDGVYKLMVERPADFTVKAMKPKHIADCTPYSLAEIKPGSTSTPRDLYLDKLEVNKTFRIDNIYYDFDKFEIRADAKPELDKLVSIMNENPINVELGSHTDSRGSFTYNEKLSQNRAQSAVNYIVSKGIGSSRITAKGYGERILTNKCSDGIKCTDEEHQANRRTEFKVLGFAPTAITDQFDPDKFNHGEELDVRLMPGGFFSPCK